MGFFTKKDKVKRSPPKQKPSYSEPPNVFVPSDTAYNHNGSYAPQVPPRPTAATASRSNDRRPHGHQYGYPQPAGYLPAPPDQQYQHQHQHHYAPVIVNQHYYGYTSSQPHLSHALVPYSNPGKPNTSMANLARDFSAVPNCSDGLSAWYGYSANLVSSTVHACDDIANRLNHVLTMIDREHLKGHEMDLFSYRHPVAAYEEPPRPDVPHTKKSSRDGRSSRDRHGGRDRERGGDHKDRSRPQTTDVATSVIRGNYFSKVDMYANSKLPRDLAPFAVYIPTWPLLCLAAQHSLAVYDRPSGPSRESYVSADWRTGSKAMCIKSIPMDSMHTIVFAIRGTSSFMDWAVNLNTAPVAPENFLDDAGNLCHAGFLTVARRMVGPVASRLRELLREDPARSRYSLLITGHSAGGAVASLLYAHMLARTAQARSELNVLTDSFRRVHCVTFGTPPLSLLPLMRPDRPELKNSVFLSFINEGDPVARADKGYVMSLLELLASPVPDVSEKARPRRGRSRPGRSSKPVWPVPECTLSNAGRIVVLRSGRRGRETGAAKDRMTVRERLAEGVVGNVCREDQLRGVVWGDPSAHLMKLYAGRIEALAVEAVTASKY